MSYWPRSGDTCSLSRSSFLGSAADALVMVKAAVEEPAGEEHRVDGGEWGQETADLPVLLADQERCGEDSSKRTHCATRAPKEK